MVQFCWCHDNSSRTFQELFVVAVLLIGGVENGFMSNQCQPQPSLANFSSCEYEMILMKR